MSCPPEQRGEVAIQLALEVVIECRLRRLDKFGRRRREILGEIFEVHADEAERARVIEHGQEDELSARGTGLGEIELSLGARVVQARERSEERRGGKEWRYRW